VCAGIARTEQHLTIFLAFLNFTLLRPDRNLKIGQVVSLPIPCKRLRGKVGKLPDYINRLLFLSTAVVLPPFELWLNARVVLLLDVARFRPAVRVLCRLDAGEELRLDAAVGRSWTSRFSIPTGTVRSLLMRSKCETLRTPPVSSVQEQAGSPQGD
jgi:hypothetical protein